MVERISPDIVELLPCPFCGGEAGYYPSGEAVFKANWIGHVCHCKDCQARVSTAIGKDSAVLLWNRRASQPATPINQPGAALAEPKTAAAITYAGDGARPNRELDSPDRGHQSSAGIGEPNSTERKRWIDSVITGWNEADTPIEGRLEEALASLAYARFPDPAQPSRIDPDADGMAQHREKVQH